jgi:ankyrin repeat protein
MSNEIGPQNGIPAGLFGESSRAGNQSEIEASALSHFFRLRSGSRELQEITPCLRRSCVVVSAAKSAHDDIVEGLLRNGPISQNLRGSAAVLEAAENGHTEIIERLLPNLEISVVARGCAVWTAAQNGHTEIIERLLQNGPISDEDRGLAVDMAAENGYTEIIERLLQNGPIRESLRGLALVNATRYGHVDVIDTLLRNGPISEYNRGLAVYIAVGNGHVEVIDMLLRNGPISERDRGLALENAARNGHIHIIERLLEGAARIPQHHLNEAVFLLNDRGLAFPALNALVDNVPLANHYEDGINVHNGQRDDKTRAALELLWKHTDAGKIEEHFQSCISYLEGLPESGKKTLALKALSGPREAFDNFPPLLDKESFSCNRFSLTGKELIGRLWGFISGCDPNNQYECKEGMVTALSTSFEHGSLVCNQGKTQRLLIAVLQGRLKGVQIDDLAPVLSPDHALAHFFKNERRQHINNKEQLLAEANSFLEDNPIVHRESFMAKLEEYWNLRDEAQGGAAQEE